MSASDAFHCRTAAVNAPTHRGDSLLGDEPSSPETDRSRSNLRWTRDTLRGMNVEHAIALLFELGPPKRYTARLGSSGWLEGHGFTEEAALRDLARAIAELEPELLATEGIADETAIGVWLADRMPAATFAD